MEGDLAKQSIKVLQRGVLENDYSVPPILGYYISNIISMDLTKKSGFFFSWQKLMGGAVKMITLLNRKGWGWAVFRGGGTPK